MTTPLDHLVTALADRYRIRQELGAGGMATVYLADDLKHRREVAIKVLRPDLGMALGADRFAREIEIAGQLTHPHIVPMYDSGTADGFVYYVQPFIDGESLRERLDRASPLPIDETLAILREVADALAKAHDQDVVHRDIKPANIMLSDGHALVTDFGIAKAVTDASEHDPTAADTDHITSAGTAVGTPAYMAPEQAAADPTVDHRADLYALGAVGYEMLTGRPPFDARSIQQILVAHVRETAPTIRSARPDVPQNLERAIMRCLDKEPDRRFPDARAFRTAIDEVSRSGEVAVRTPGTWRARPGLIGAVVVALAIVIVAGVLLSRAPGRSSLDADVIAVAPFDVLGPDLDLWREGFAELVAHNLDGAGRLRSVSPTVSFARWSGRADPASASRLAEDLGAGLAVFGRITAEGADSIRVDATLMQVPAGTVIRDVNVRGPEQRAASLADSVAALFLTDLSRLRSLGAAQLNSLGSTSPTAIREFLRGERHYRSFRMDSAALHYHRALDTDSVFALAYGRLGMIAAWNGTNTGLADSFRLAAGALNHGLSVRESLLVAADSLASALSGWRPEPAFQDRMERYFLTLRQALDLYPGDAQIVYRMGEAQMHRGWAQRVSEELTLATFESAAALDSAFALVYPHMMSLRYSSVGLDAGHEATRAYLSLRPSGPSAIGAETTLELATQLYGGNRAFLDTASAYQLLGTVGMLGRSDDSLEAAVLAARRLIERDPGQRFLAATTVMHRGRFREAREILADPMSGSDWMALAEMDYLEGRPPLADYPEAPTPLDDAHPMLALLWWTDHADTLAIQDFIRRRQDPDTPVRWGAPAWQQFAIDRARAFLWLARGDSAAALDQFDRLSPYLCPLGCGVTPLVHGRLLLDANRNAEAARVLDGFPTLLIGPIFPTEIPWRLERARARARSGNRPGAVADYARVVNTWRNADPSLQGLVEQAERELAVLAGEALP